jgi:hypothetical protein
VPPFFCDHQFQHDGESVNPIDDEDPYRRVFFPHTHARIASLGADGGRFAYYTSAEVAARILSNREVWMRNTMAMNDFMEVSYGAECLHAALDGEAGKCFDAVLDLCHAGLSQEVRGFFRAWMPGIRWDSYITCVSEHDPNEDQFGRLSMWRAYVPMGAALGLHSQ